MNTACLNGEELEKLVDRHIELCELFDGMRSGESREPRSLVTMSEGKGIDECLVALVDRALVAYEFSGFHGDPMVPALKFALVQTIVGNLGCSQPGA